MFIQIAPPPTTGDYVNELLVWIIGVLIAFITALYLYFNAERKQLREELKDERNYSRTQDNKNIEQIISSNHVLGQLIKQTDKNSDYLTGIKGDVSQVKNNVDVVYPIIQSNVERLEKIARNVSKFSDEK